jgi:hypothetical protein
MYCQKPGRNQSSQKSHSSWHVQTGEIPGIGSWIFGREYDFIDYCNILTAYFLSLKILT